MVFAVPFLVQALLASAVLAAPRGDRFSQRVERRRAARNGNPINAVDRTTHGSDGSITSDNWSGASWGTYPAGTFTSVTGTFTVPTPSAPSNGSGTYSSSGWVGIDGYTCQTAILQTGVDFTVDADSGEVSYDAWYEWYPDYAHDFNNFEVNAGDVITATVTATSTKKGSAVLENVTTGKTVTKNISSKSALCLENAEWIVEDYESGDSLVPLANFGTVVFTNALGTTANGTVGPDGAEIINIAQSSTTLTSVLTNSSSVTVTYL